MKRKKIKFLNRKAKKTLPLSILEQGGSDHGAYLNDIAIFFLRFGSFHFLRFAGGARTVSFLGGPSRKFLPDRPWPRNFAGGHTHYHIIPGWYIMDMTNIFTNFTERRDYEASF